jgi:hypothetical protein
MTTMIFKYVLSLINWYLTFLTVDGLAMKKLNRLNKESSANTQNSTEFMNTTAQINSPSESSKGMIDRSGEVMINKSLSMTFSSRTTSHLLDKEILEGEGFSNRSLYSKGKLITGIKNVVHELHAIEEDEEEDNISEKTNAFIDVFSLKVNIDFLFQKNTVIKYQKESDLEIINCISIILTVWGLAISTPYYLLAAPLYNVWRFLVLFGSYLVVAVFSGHWVPDLIILISTFLGFVFFALKFEEVDYSVKKFLNAWGLVLLKKYIKFFLLTLIATGFTFYISPFLIQSANYYSSGISYETCYHDWWWNLLMLGNFSPSGYYGMSGCIPWIWILSGIFQFWWVIPWFILLHSKSKIFNYLALTLLSGVSIGLTMYLVYTYEFKVGVLAFENLEHDVFYKVVKSPFTKMHLLLLGFAFSRFYLAVQKHKSGEKTDKKSIISKIYRSKSKIFATVLWIVLFAVFGAYLFIGRSALINPYAWSKWENTLFYGFAKFLIYFVLLLLMFILMTDNAPTVKGVFMNSYFWAFSKLSVWVFMIYPTVIFFLYCSGAEANYVSYPTVVYSAVHHFVVSYSISFVLTLIVLIPLIKVVNKIKLIMT